MLTLAHWLGTLTTRTHAVADRDSVDFQLCCYVSLLGVIVSLAFLHLYGPDAFLALADAG